MILCCGEALIDMIPPVDGSIGFVPHTGGAVFNTAIALGRLGVPVGLLAGLSRDMFGDQLRTALARDEVDARLTITSDRPSTLAFVQLNEGHARYSFFDENSAGRMLQPEDMPTLPAQVSALFFGGISLACAPSADAYAALLQQQGAERAVMIDPNIRPSFIENEPRYRQRLTSMLARADIVKVSDEDLDWIVPGDSGFEPKARNLLDLGPRIVIGTQGARGAMAFVTAGEALQVDAQATQVVDTVGAGDTFNAGLLASLSDQGLLTKTALHDLTGSALLEAMTFAARCAAVTVSRAGANPPYPAEIT